MREVEPAVARRRHLHLRPVQFDRIALPAGCGGGRRVSASRATLDVVPLNAPVLASRSMVTLLYSSGCSCAMTVTQRDVDAIPGFAVRNSTWAGGGVGRPHVLLEEREQRRPVDALVAPPVARARALVVGEVGVERAEQRAHEPCLGHGDVVVLVAVEHVDAVVQEVPSQVSGFARMVRPRQHRLGRRGVLVDRPAAVGREAPPAGARRDRRPRVGHVGADRPGPVAAHRVSGEIGARRVGVEGARGVGEDFERVEPSPVLPVEPVGAAVGRRDDHRPVLGFVGARLAGAFNARAVQRDDERRADAAGRSDVGRDAVVLDAPVDLAHERPHVVRGRLDRLQRDRERRQVERARSGADAAIQRQLDRPFGSTLRAARSRSAACGS